MQLSSLKLLIKDFIKEFLSFLGLKISRRSSGLFGVKNNFVYQFEPTKGDKFNWLKTMNINTVIDVGAHQGEWALELCKILGYPNFYCFEPVRSNFLELSHNLNLPNFKLFNLAVGDRQGKLQMYRNNFLPGSSILKCSEFHLQTFPFSANEEVETIDINTLDEIFKLIDLKDNILLKIDVQGYEDKVIFGAKNILERIKVVIVETSFCELYEGQALFTDIYQLLSKQGFIYSGSLEELKSPRDGIPLQQDSLFIKK
ncbi:FkbM family methyltransferase [Allocoleopsis franciscana]|uniref:Methyltransferase, FkbM family n=1 Tax=Allocoleopsis franciscana PCC 7113 TaxID=1173027 RepID=K9WK51_9CYAN|nr:FkbM family methyltransferase [Allocoleopsis franciscana]AFZ20139.1 methyltransferase, FkbM family [Allocoleopsis franciscana PCC 7113]